MAKQRVDSERLMRKDKMKRKSEENILRLEMMGKPEGSVIAINVHCPTYSCRPSQGKIYYSSTCSSTVVIPLAKRPATHIHLYFYQVRSFAAMLWLDSPMYNYFLNTLPDRERRD